MVDLQLMWLLGWFKNEFEMFDTKWRDHKNRYKYLEEWTLLLKRLWQENEAFDFEGDFFQGKSLWSQPKPLQTPYPPIMNAGSSPNGQLFSAKHANMNFVMLKQKDRDSDAAQINHLKNLALDLIDLRNAGSMDMLYAEKQNRKQRSILTTMSLRKVTM